MTSRHWLEVCTSILCEPYILFSSLIFLEIFQFHYHLKECILCEDLVSFCLIVFLSNAI